MQEKRLEGAGKQGSKNLSYICASGDRAVHFIQGYASMIFG